jgi:phage shock protein C
MSMPPNEGQAEPARKRLYRSRRDRVIAGVAGGMAEYFGMDPVLLRVVFVAVLIFTAFLPATIFYLLCILIIPTEP